MTAYRLHPCHLYRLEMGYIGTTVGECDIAVVAYMWMLCVRG